MPGEVRKVLMTTDTVGGVFTYSLTLAAALCDEGVSVDLATMGDRMRPEQREAAATIPSLTVHESSFALEWMDEPWADVARAGDWLAALERTLRPDVVHLNGYALATAGFTAPVIVFAHSCVISWWEATLGEPAPPKYDRYRAAVRAGLEAADVVVAPTRAMLDALERHHGSVRATHVIANGAEPPRESRAPKEPFVLAAGRIWDRAKNIQALLRVAPRLAWPVRIAGWAADDAGGVRNVDALGWRGPRELAMLMERAAVFALPARYEPFGLSALEAALRGCALVLGDVPSLREVWGDAATFVPPNDEEALASALDRLARDATFRAAMGVRARRRALRFSARACGAATLALYRNLVSRKSLPSCA